MSPTPWMIPDWFKISMAELWSRKLDLAIIPVNLLSQLRLRTGDWNLPLKHRGINHFLIQHRKYLIFTRDPTKNIWYLRVSAKNSQGKIGGKLATNSSHGASTTLYFLLKEMNFFYSFVKSFLSLYCQYSFNNCIQMMNVCSLPFYLDIICTVPYNTFLV